MTQSFDSKTGLMYIPYMQSGVQFRKGKPIDGGVFVSGMGIKESIADSDDGKGALLAWDSVNQKQVWKVQHPYIWNGGAMSSAGDLVFQGTADGDFSAYNATTGAPLWKYDAGMGIIAAPMSYSVNGKQYISILAGYGGSAAIWGNLMNVGWKFSSPRRLLTFALDGNAPHPPSPPRDMTLHPVDDPNIKINPADAAAGSAMFLACSACHGRDLVSAGGPAPDLRESKIALNPDSFWSVVHDGALMPNGMPAYGFFSRQQVMQLYAYVRTGAREALTHPH
jgi:quinohemoprotein ethanol dehydrogenase